MLPGSGFWRFDNNSLTDPLYMNNSKNVVQSTVLEYIKTKNDNKSDILNCETSEFTMIPYKLKSSLLLDDVLLKVREAKIKYNNEKKRNCDAHIKKRESEYLQATNILTSTAWKSVELKESLAERISEINNGLDVLNTIKAQMEARKIMAKINLDAETPTR